jgi:gliding motility-associated-like protein
MRNFLKFTFIVLLTLCAKAQVPTATILSASAVYCTDANTFFAAKTNTNSTYTYTWALPANRGASFVSGFNAESVVCTFATPGAITISLTVAAGTASAVFTKAIIVTRSARASFNASLTETGFPTELSLTSYATNSLKSYWIYSGNAARDSADYLVKPYPASGSYTVTQVAVGKNGCNDTLSYSFHISDSSGITLPNVFSPNGDNVNEVFRPIVRGISDLKGWVYNRYGNLIASWDRVNGFWDGYTTSGLACASGEYFVVIEAKGFDGRSYKLKSTITLVR